MRTRALTLLFGLFFANFSSACADEEKLEKSHLIGVWLAHEFPVKEGLKKPRIEFKANGKFRTRGPLGTILHGTWKWMSDDSIKLSYTRFKTTSEITISTLLKDSMTTFSEKETHYKRLKSWDAGE